MKRKVTALTSLGMVLMFSNVGIQALIAAGLGAGAERDALFVALSVPLFVNTLMVASFGAVATPAVIAAGSLTGQRQVAMRMVTWLTAAAFVCALLLFVFRGLLVAILAPGFDSAQHARTVALFAITLGMIPIQSTASVLSGYWVARDRVLLPSIAMLLGNLVVTVVLASTGRTVTAEVVAWASFAGAAVVFLTVGACFLAEQTKKGEASAATPVRVAAIYKRSLPLLVASMVGRSSPLIERNFASGMSQGTISCLGYAGTLLAFLINMTTTPAATVYYTRMCRDWEEGRRDELATFLEKGLLTIAWLSVAIGGTVVLTARPVFQILVPYTRFTATTAGELANYCSVLMVAYIFLALGGFSARMFYAAGEFVTAAVLDCAAVGFYLITAFPLARLGGGLGLAAAASLNGVFLACLIGAVVNRRLGIRISAPFLRSVGVTLTTALAGLGASELLLRAMALRTSAPLASLAAPLFYLGLLGTCLAWFRRRPFGNWMAVL